MDRRYVKESDFKNPLNLNSGESMLYRREVLMYKFIHSDFREGRELIIEGIDKDNIKHAYKIDSILYDKDTYEFIGYSFEAFKRYITLSQFYQSKLKQNSFSDRKKGCGQFIETIRDLQAKGYEHRDLNGSNILIKRKKMRVVDLDGMTNPSIFPVSDNHKHWVRYMEERSLEIVGYVLLNYEPGGRYTIRTYNEFIKDDVVMALIGLRNHVTISDLFNDGFRVEDLFEYVDEELFERFDFTFKSK